MVLGRPKPKICKSVVGVTSYSIINGMDCGVIADLFGGGLLLWLNVNWTRLYRRQHSKASIGLFSQLAIKVEGYIYKYEAFCLGRVIDNQ